MSTRSSAGCPRPVDRLADLGDVAGHAGRRLVVHHGDGLDGVGPVLGEARARSSAGPRRGASRPARSHRQAQPLGHRPPGVRELAGLEHQHAVARRQRVDQRRLPGAGARRGKDDHRPAGLEHRPQPVEHLAARAPGTRARGDRWSGGPSPAARDPARWWARESAGNDVPDGRPSLLPSAACNSAARRESGTMAAPGTRGKVPWATPPPGSMPLACV